MFHLQARPSAPERVFKLVFVGDSGVGKSSYIHRFCNNTFKPSFSATIGMASALDTVQIKHNFLCYS